MGIVGGLVPLLVLVASVFGVITGVAVIRSREIAWDESHILRGSQAALAGWMMCVVFGGAILAVCWLTVRGI